MDRLSDTARVKVEVEITHGYGQTFVRPLPGAHANAIQALTGRKTVTPLDRLALDALGITLTHTYMQRRHLLLAPCYDRHCEASIERTEAQAIEATWDTVETGS